MLSVTVIYLGDSLTYGSRAIAQACFAMTLLRFLLPCLVHVIWHEEEQTYRREVDSVPWYLAVVKDSHPVMAPIKSCHLGS